uniref:ATP synthase subunit a n=1 Tax=Allothyrus sp. LamingtonNP-QMS95173 TaxID=1442165 RepID=W0FGL3_9ACAR|nr:ATP synthase subunit 6 [Allothyrus sp. LamingtonNP-QMS95173]
MMTNLFSIFDPSSSSLFNFNWLSIIMSLFLFPFLFWTIPSRFQMSINYLFLSVKKELINNFILMNYNSLWIFLALFWFILINNFMGLYPYIFTATSHISLTLMMSFPFWLMLMLFGWINYTNHMFTHLVPTGTPMILSSFMVCIESISNIIRPITLAIRLAANMIAGHLLLTLLSNILEKLPNMILMIIPLIIMLLILEAAVAIIQSYVFVTLASLYLNEIN